MQIVDREIMRQRTLERATAIATKKKVPTEKLAEILKSFEGLETFEQLVDQCGKTAREHGFWEAHLRTALDKIGITYDTFSDWFAANVADHPTYLDDAASPEKVKEFDEAAARGRRLSEVDCAKCDVINTLVFHRVVGDPFIFLGLICTEVCESMESCRKANWEDPDGVFEELADAVIRIFDFVARFSGPTDGYRKDSADQFVSILKAKMAVNECRPFLHGKKF